MERAHGIIHLQRWIKRKSESSNCDIGCLIISYATCHLIDSVSQPLQDPLRKIELRQHQSNGAGSTASTSASPVPSGYITSVSFTPDSADEYDLLVGMSNGEGND
jgi:hypothetical protein